jgi:preprotein translocase subunit SecA
LRVIKETNDKIKKKENMKIDPKCLLLLKKNEKISRNDRCEATGKKFKNCCGSL